MNSMIVQTQRGVTLVGAGPVTPVGLRAALRLAPHLVAADGGADRVLAAGLMPEAVIGDCDSISAGARARLPAGVLHLIAEQDTTDFDKALRHIAAPFVLAVGFAGGRVDHTLGVFNTLVRRADQACFVLSPRDVVFVAPEEVTLRLKPGSRLSLFPMGAVAGESEGLRWPIGGVGFAPDGAVGVSNEVSAPLVRLRFSARRMLVILPRAALLPAIESRVPGFVRSDALGG
ncbi:thiamine pyrophosphokinase [mine drainage metagenome]|uniref:Thiamine pyrophosphokinase n=1 Tax=mine drainage metagenome TaxID=410659 RepID=A0A1J5QDJ3_9ZZZZ